MLKLFPKKKLSVSVSAWFCIPEQGMEEMEILSRASAFMVKSMNNYPNKVHLLTASHVIAPWRFPKYYPDEWLQYVNEKHTSYTIEVWHEDGKSMTKSELIPSSFHHTTRDLAVLHFKEEATALKLFDECAIEIQDLANYQLTPGEPLKFHGHEVSIPNAIEVENFNSGKDNREPVPMVVSGHFFHGTKHQLFAKTNPVLTYGMCGGPVTVKCLNNTISATGVNKTISTTEVCGLLEGIIPFDIAATDLRGLASFVDTTVISQFLSDIEMGSAHFESKCHTKLIGAGENDEDDFAV